MLVASQPSALAAATIPANSLANACAGVSLPPSVVTNLLSPVINGVVSPLQSSVNGLLSVLTPKLNIDATSLLNNAASGQPISLKLLSSDGTIIGSNGSCFSQASGFTLSGTSGISIGGNQITGLGSGATANAGEINSIAFGNNAVTAPTTVGAGAIAIGTNANVGSLGAAGVALGNNAAVLGTNGMALGNGASVGILGTGAVALGNGASATTANSVAIGAGSIASRVVLPGGAAEVSIGAPGSERQLTNLAAGTATTDAVNLGQLNVVAGNVATNAQNIATLTTNVGTNTQNITTLQGGLASATASVGQLQTGLAGVNASVGTLQSGLSTANANIGSLQTSVTANTAGLGTANSNIASLQGTVTANGTAIGQLQTGLATTNGTVSALQTSVNANTTGLTTANTNIASLQGTVAANGTAIGQLQTGLTTANGNIGALQTSVTANTAGLTTATNNIAGLQTAITANTSGLATATGNIATLQGAVSTNTANLAANVADVATLKTNVATNTGAIGTLSTGLNGLTTTVGNQGTAITANASAIDALHSAAVNGTIGPVQFTTAANPLTASGSPTNDVALVGGATGAVKLHNVASGSVAIGSTDAVNGGQLATVANQVGSIANLAVQYDDPTHTTLSLGGTGSAPVLLANVKAGTLAADSTQAVNGSQLFATNNAVALNGQNIATLNGQVGQNTSAITGLQGVVQTNTGDIATANANIAALNSAVGQNTTNTNTNTVNIGNLTAQVNTNTGLLSQQGSAITANANALVSLRNDTANGAIGPVQYSNPLTPTVPNGGTPTNDLTLVGRDPAPVHLHNVADGVVAAGSKDGVNGGQLFALSSQMGSLSDLAVQYDDASKASVTLSNALGGPVALKNIQAGTLSATSNDAVNGSQLFATNQNVTNVQASVNNQGAQLTTLNSQVSNGAIGPVQYSSTLAPTTPNGGTVSQDLTLVGAANAPVGLHNVAQGTLSASSTDAVNGSQLFATNNQISSLAGLSVQYDNGQHNRITLGGPLAAPVAVANVANGQIAAGSTDAVNGGQLFTLSSQMGSLSNLAVQYDDATRAKITLSSALGTPTTLSGIAPAILSATSTDAVNGAQLYATNQTVSGLQTQVTSQTTLYQTLGNQYVSLNAAINAGAVGPVRYSDASNPTQPNGGTPSQDLTLVGAANGPVGLHNVAPATLSATSTDAVNGSQLFATNQNVTNIQTNLDAQGNQLTNLNTQLTQNTTNLGNLTTQVSNGGIGPVQYSSSSDPTTPNGGLRSQDLTLVGANSGPVALHNLAPAMLSMTSLDAVNGSQLVALGNATANIFGGNYAYNPTTNSYSGSFSYGGNSYANIQSVLGAIQSSVSVGGGSGSGSIPQSVKYFHTTSTMTDSAALGADSTAIGPTATSSGDASIAVGRNSNASGGSAVAIGDGATAQDGKAVSIGVGNIASGDGAVSIGDPNTATGEGAAALGKDNTATGTGAIAMGNTSTAVGNGAVALGNVNNASGNGSVALGNANSASGAGAIAIGSSNSVTGDGSLAIGTGITTSANDTLSIGNTTVASAVSAVALGNRAQATGDRALSVGTDTTATGTEASSFGTHSDATGDYATALGADAQANGLHSASLGFQATASADLTTALGADSQATTIYATAVGQMATASGLASAALGASATASGYASAALGTGSIANEDGSVALGVATQTVRGAVSNYAAFGLSGLQSSQGEIAIARNVQYTDPNTGQLTPIGNRQITGLAAGSADTDAVNVSQLRGVSSVLGNAFATGLGGGSNYNSATGQLTGPSYTFGGVTYSNVGDALQALAANGTGTGTGSGSGGTSTGNSVTYVDSSKSTVALASGGTKIQNVAPGEVSATSTDAVNGSQLNATNEQVSQLSSQVNNGAVGVVRYANASAPTQSNGGTQTNDATLVGANAAAPVALHNVASGSVAEASTDAVNGGQLYATNQAVSRAQSTADTAMTMSANSVQYDSPAQNSVTLGNAASGAVALHNVADGQSPRDAVNLGQMNAAVASAVSQANGYTDGKIAALSFDLRKVNRNANAGTAGAMALAGMPQPYEAGKGMISMGMATYQGQTAIAFGASKAFNDGHTVMKVGGTYNSSGSVGVSVGAGYQF